MLGRVVLPIVDAQDDRDVLVLRRGGDDDLLGAGVDVRVGLQRVGEEAGRLDDDVHTELAPRQGARVALGQHLELLAIDGEGAITGHHAVQTTVHGVVLDEVRERLGVGQVVDGNDLHARVAQRRAEHEAPDAPETVDADSNGHASGPLS